MTGGRSWHTSSGSDSDASFESDDSSIEEVVVVNEIIQTVAAAPAPAAREEPASSSSREAQIARHQRELRRLDDEMRRIEELRRNEKRRIRELTLQLGGGREADSEVTVKVEDSNSAIVNYFGRFAWSKRMKEQMVGVFGIRDFRLAQEGVCNANMDGRNIVCVMPTGGGKSLTYQLPATLMPGCTLVVSPLVALIRDQDLHLQEKQIECLAFTAKMPPAKITEGYNRLRDLTGKEVKLCYVTPERLAQSDGFRSIVKAMVAANKLTRIVIDEAHCISQLGRDYRPQYKQLAELRTICPRVPILALSATCPPNVLRDLIGILSLPPLTNGTAAEPHDTVLFTSPLYRKNLHYKVLPKSSDRACATRDMLKYILDHHPDETGIVYCLSRADAKRVAEELRDESQGRIKTGIYHAEIDDKEKEELHESWLKGKVKVVCATTAFGLGINKANVRFVMHHSMPKSLEAFYQESGRAGRDGKDADCILYYRLLDALRTAGMKADTDWQQQEAHDMIKFCLDLKECRKLKFTKHFSSTDFFWAEDNTPCGHCDNCTRDPASVVQKDVTSDAERVLAIARTLTSRKTNFTAVQLARTARGSGELAKPLNLAREDKVTLSLLDTEVLVAHLLLEGYLQKFTMGNQYTVQVYVKPAPNLRSFDDDNDGHKLIIQLQLLPSDHPSPDKRRKRSRKGPRKKAAAAAHSSPHDDGDDNEDGDCFGDCSGEDGEEGAGPSESAGRSPAKRRRRSKNYGSSSRVAARTVTVDSDPEWMPPRRRRSGRRRKVEGQKKQGQGRVEARRRATKTLLDDEEVIEIAADDEIIEISSN